jgi:hypothetical protein
MLEPSESWSPARAFATSIVISVSLCVASGSAFGTAPSSASASRLPPCTSQPSAVSASHVPDAVKVLTHGMPVIGSGSLWALQSATEGTAVRLPDGTHLMKFPWFLNPPVRDTPMITGRRLDGRGTFRYDANVAIDGSRTFATSSLYFSALGCWQVKGHYRGSTVSIRLRVRPNPVTG